MSESEEFRRLYLAGGCFWGVQAYLDVVHGVVATTAGYANGPTPTATYDQVCAGSGHVEAVEVAYDPEQVNVPFLLEVFFAAVDPTATPRSPQYRTGVYPTDDAEALVVELELAALARRHTVPLQVEHPRLTGFHPAEQEHQHYLGKNPAAACRIPTEAFAAAAQATPQRRFLREDATLRASLTPLQYEVLVHGATEVATTGELEAEFAPGIYVDVTDGRPLFVSSAKYESGCGWPAFTRPVDEESVVYVRDVSRGRDRLEVRTALSDLHLGHVLDDGPPQEGGRRFCVNSAALRFVPRDRMADEGYGHLVGLVDAELSAGATGSGAVLGPTAVAALLRSSPPSPASAPSRAPESRP